MTWRAKAFEDITQDRIELHLWVPGDRTIDVAQPAELVMATEVKGQPAPRQPWVRLDDGAARALLDALTAHYGGSSDQRQLRADYDAERRRLDKMLDWVMRTSVAVPDFPGSPQPYAGG
jgi:hypothetical protein